MALFNLSGGSRELDKSDGEAGKLKLCGLHVLLERQVQLARGDRLERGTQPIDATSSWHANAASPVRITSEIGLPRNSRTRATTSVPTRPLRSR
jgi:hypothetical protein